MQVIFFKHDIQGGSADNIGELELNAEEITVLLNTNSLVIPELGIDPAYPQKVFSSSFVRDEQGSRMAVVLVPVSYKM